MIAGHLLKFCYFYEDAHGIKVKLWYLRDREKREVDFLVTWEGKPWFLVEAKLKAQESDAKHLRYFANQIHAPEAYLVTAEEGLDYMEKDTSIRMISASKFLTGLI